MGDEAQAPPWQLRAPLALLMWLAGLLVAGKLVLLATSGTFMDEAYYWLWGQHPALSYYDHPPLNAWLQGLAGAIFGWNRLGLRIGVALALMADILVLYLLARKLAPAHWAQHFWLTLVLFLATPMFFAVTAVALPDHLLVLFSLATIYCVVVFLEAWRADPRTAWKWLYLGAVCLGLAALSKYNAALLGLGLAALVVGARRYRGLLRHSQTYLAAGITLVMQAPVVIWNLEQHGASFAFILGGRHVEFSIGAPGGIGWLTGLLLFLSPFMLLPIARLLLARRAGDAVVLARLVFLVSTAVILAVSLVTATLFHWNLVAYLAILPVIVWYFRWPLLYWAQVAYGTVFLGLVIVNYAIVPLTDVQTVRDEASAWTYGWEATAASVEAARQAHGAGFVATPDYSIAALLAYALQDPDVTSLAARTDQFDFWFDATAHTGGSAIVVADNWRPLTPEQANQFESLTLLEEIPVVRLGKPLDVHRIYLGRGFQPAR